MIKYILPIAVAMTPTLAFAGAPKPEINTNVKQVDVKDVKNPYEGMEVVLYDRAAVKNTYTSNYTTENKRYISYRELSKYQVEYNGKVYTNRIVEIIEEPKQKEESKKSP